MHKKKKESPPIKPEEQKTQTAEECEKKIAELTDLLQRLQAEFENYRKRIEKDFERHKSYAHFDLIHKLLPILDSFDSALNHLENHEQFVSGIRMIHSELKRLLEKEGLRQIDCLDKPLDPYRHEVLLQQLSDKDGIVLEELQKGYMLFDKVLRCSKVKLGKAHDGCKDNGKESDIKKDKANNKADSEAGSAESRQKL
jgi:molecular chaperone GrpE